ncbi:hypothetical protein Tco_0055575, partial [Tanacetum coccineum]
EPFIHKEEIDLETAQTTTTPKLPILKLENGNSFKPVPQTTTNADGSSTTLILGPVNTEEKVQKKNDVKARNLAPQRQEMSVENVSLGLVPQGQMASDYDNSDPVPPRQHVVPTEEKTYSSQQGLEFLFSPLLEEYYNPTHSQAEENNNDQAPNASFREAEFINPFCTRLATDPEMCMFALTVSVVEPKNIKEAMADSAHRSKQFRLNFARMNDLKLKVMLRKRVLILKNHLH